jgi:hypothetical protein
MRTCYAPSNDAYECRRPTNRLSNREPPNGAVKPRRASTLFGTTQQYRPHGPGAPNQQASACEPAKHHIKERRIAMSHEFVKQITSRERSESTDRVGGPKEREAVGYRFHGWFQILSGAVSRDWELIVVAPLSRERLTGHAIWPKKHMSGYATYQALTKSRWRMSESIYESVQNRRKGRICA